MQYAFPHQQTIPCDRSVIYSFLGGDSGNIDWQTVNSFGEEWTRFDQFSDQEVQRIGDEYFSLVTDQLNENSTVLDVGCGEQAQCTRNACGRRPSPF